MKQLLHRTTRWLGLAACCGVAAAQSPAWITFQNQTATRLPTAANFVNDPDEKDFCFGDVDNDGDVDLIDCQKNDVYANVSARTHRLLLNTGGQFIEGSATYAPDFALNPSVARLGILGDFTGDGWLDLVVVNTNDTGFGSTTQNQLHFYRNLGANGSGQWLGFVFDTTGRFPQYTAPYARFCAGDKADFDQDGDLDLYLGDYNNSLEDRLLFNDGLGNFSDVTAARIPGGSDSGFSVEIQVGDFNGDGWPDLARSDPGSVMVRINNGAGFFNATAFPPAPATYTLAVGDLNNDGLADVYQGRDGQDGYDLNTTVGVGSQNVTFSSFTLAQSPGTGGFAGNATIVDMDNDGFKDVIMGDIDVDVPGCDRHATVLRNTPGAAIILSDPWATVQPWHTNGTHDVAAVDLNGDGLKDMVYAKCVGYSVWIQVPPPMLLAVTEPQPGALNIDVSYAPPNAALFNLASLVQLPNPGLGPFFGLDASAFTLFTAFYPSPPFVGQASPTGSYSFALPAGTFPQTVPWTWQMRTVALTGGGFLTSNIVTATF
jgi:hypothetical protein